MKFILVCGHPNSGKTYALREFANDSRLSILFSTPYTQRTPFPLLPTNLAPALPTRDLVAAAELKCKNEEGPHKIAIASSNDNARDVDESFHLINYIEKNIFTPTHIVMAFKPQRRESMGSYTLQAIINYLTTKGITSNFNNHIFYTSSVFDNGIAPSSAPIMSRADHAARIVRDIFHFI